MFEFASLLCWLEFAPPGWRLHNGLEFAPTGWSLFRGTDGLEFASTGWSLHRQDGVCSVGWSLLHGLEFARPGWSLHRHAFESLHGRFEFRSVQFAPTA